jgi:hypothetical protein
MTKIILAAGSSRSGSTWQYNVLRIAHILRRIPAHCAWVQDYNSVSQEAVHIIKLHEPNESLFAENIVTSYRDLRDVIVSARRVGWPFHSSEDVANFVDYYISMFERWKPVSCYSMRYEDMIAEPEKTAEDMLRSGGGPARGS